MRKLILIGILTLSLMTWAFLALAGPGCKAQRACQKAAYSCPQAHSEARLNALEGINVETTRLPSGGMLVVYTSDKPEAIQALQRSAGQGTEGFDCRLCSEIAGDKNCSVELAVLEDCVIAVVTAEDKATIDSYEKQFAALTGPAK
jgi:hypothetical protein